MINATAVNAVPVLEDVCAGTTQGWSLRLNEPQHGHGVVPHGCSHLVESFVWLVPLARIDRLIALSFDSMDHGAWPFSVGGVTCLVNSVSVCEEKREERKRRSSSLNQTDSRPSLFSVCPQTERERETEKERQDKRR